LRFELRLEKHRRLSEQEAKPCIVDVPLERRRRGDGSERTIMGEWMKRSLEATLEERILDLYQKEYSIADIAKEIGKSEATIRYHMKTLERQGRIEAVDRRARGARLRHAS
jgi:DNA-binding transcriptional ArsR family regulator